MADNKKLVAEITSMDEDFTQWYTDVCIKADLVSYSNIKGCLVIKPAGYAEAYGSNMPWAIVVPGDFKYPIEWKVIGARKNGTLEGAYETPGHSFAEWAEDSSQATDWYLYPTAGSVYE